MLLYFFAINTSYLVCSVLAFFRLRQHRHRWTTRELESVVQSPATPGVSVIAPAYNEQATIVESMRSLLLLNYPQFEVICGNDGSKDETLRRAIAAFDLVEAPMAVGGGLADGEGARHLPLADARRVRAGRQGERRPGRRAQRRHQRGALSADLPDRRRLAARAERAHAGGAAVPRVAGHARRRRHHPRRQRLQGRGRTRHRGARARRTGSRASRWSSTCAPSSPAASRTPRWARCSSSPARSASSAGRT